MNGTIFGKAALCAGGGGPGVGPTPVPMPSVTAVTITKGAVAASIRLGPNGLYSLSVPPGRYVVSSSNQISGALVVAAVHSGQKVRADLPQSGCQSAT